MRILLFLFELQLLLITWKFCEISTQLYNIKTIESLYFEEVEKNTRRIEKNTRGSTKDE